MRLSVACVLLAGVGRGEAALREAGQERGQLVSPSGAASRWVSFPSSREKHLDLHLQSQEGVIGTAGGELYAPGDVFAGQREVLGLHPACEMKLAGERRNPATNTVRQSYEQYVGGIRVYGGEFKVTLSAVHTTTSQDEPKMKIINIHGSPLTESILDTNLNNIDVNMYKTMTLVHEDITSSISTYLSSSRVQIDTYADDVDVSLTQKVELVWYQGQSDVSLAFVVRGAVLSESFVSFYAFLDASTAGVLSFVQLNDDEHLETSQSSNDMNTQSVKTSSTSFSTQSVPPSPFVSPISDAEIYCYDQYAKDFNDDQDDNYYNPDPDRFSNDTLVFDTTSGDYSYPTSDAEMNLLVDNTLYAKYLYNSLSGGQYLTWQKVDGPLNIEYNLTLANAYFDGGWGIHFGTGFITDDVVIHEWSHGYTQTGNDLVYQRQSGSMNEGFSDVFGESADILNVDSADTDVLRSSSPATCTSTMNARYGQGPSPGTDDGHRWCIGEEVSYYHWSNGDGTFRDMYKPECFFHPGATHSPYYACTTYYDNGGVHLNSGVFNHLFTVLVDGGEFTNGTTATSIGALGIVKTLNLYWRTHEELTASSDFLDFAIAINEVCTLNIGTPLYYPNIFNSTITEVGGLTSSDCDIVKNAVAASGMDNSENPCPNIACNGNLCDWKSCPTSSYDNFEIFYEDYDHYMGDSRIRHTNGKIEPACSKNFTNSYMRIFDQEYFHLDEFTLSCIQFGYIMLGQTSVTIDVYLDTDGGYPSIDTLQLLATQNITTLNANNHMQVQTVSFDTLVKPVFNTSAQTLVIMMTTHGMTDGYIAGGGQINDAVDSYGTASAQTFLGGGCLSDYIASNSTVQWYVRLQGTTTYHSGSENSGSFHDMHIIVTIVASCMIAGVCIGFSYHVMRRNKMKTTKHVKLHSDEDTRL